MNTCKYPVILINVILIKLGPGKYDLHKMNSGPKITIARRDKTFDQKCNSNPGKYYCGRTDF